jgi:hypothetical protein
MALCALPGAVLVEANDIWRTQAMALIITAGWEATFMIEAGQTVTFEIQGGGLEDGLVELKQARLRP